MKAPNQIKLNLLESHTCSPKALCVFVNQVTRPSNNKAIKTVIAAIYLTINRGICRITRKQSPVVNEFGNK